jgi:hypothetical protein
MKKSGFKRKTYEEVLSIQKAKKTSQKGNFKRLGGSNKVSNPKIQKPKLPSNKTLETKLWELCKQITRHRHEHVCYTCGASGLQGSNLQTGHGKPKGALPLKFKYDLRNLRNQCMRCNIHLGGQSDLFVAKLEKDKEGIKFLKEACVKDGNRWEVRQDQTMGSLEGKFFLIDKIDEYKNILKQYEI